ncbi:MAG TPA: serine/threonine-protein kinase [Polyangia bacterium]|nr:serine/threonine-protein kinase [Polyangia bacterium]
MRAPRGLAVSPAAGVRERFGKYEIVRRIAVGGMAEIYLARALGLEGFEKLVVLKRILPQYADNDEFVQMFLDEARVAATLHHSNVVQVYDIGSVDGQYFLSMEFLHGQDGRQLMKACATRHTPLPQEHALSIGMGVLAGLHYAHERVVDGRPLDLVHRDVSPQNVFVTYDGGIKLLDFGIARASSRLTETRGGTLKGKIAYMSPEQCGGFPLDRRSDIFAAAIILWEMTVGRRLFTGASDFEILRKVKEEDAPPPSSVISDYPRALEQIVMKGLARDRDERYSTAEEMQLELEAFARDRRLATSPINLGRFVRGLFRPELDAWQAAERSGQPGEPVVQTTPSGNLIRTETSLSGPVPPVMRTGDVPELRPRVKRAWIAVALGVVGGSLITWLLVRPASTPARVPSTVTAATHAATPPTGELPTPSAVVPVMQPPLPPAARPAPPATATPATRKAPVRRPAAKKSGAKKLPAGWDPESLLPP